MRTIAIEVPDKYCGLCRHTEWSQDGGRWTCPARGDKWTDAIINYAKPVKACRDAEVSK